KRFYKRWVKRCGQPDGLRKARRAGCGVTVQTFLVEDHRNAEATLLEEELLKGVCEVGLLARRSPAARVARPADLPDAVAVGERGARLFGIELAVRVDQRRGLLLPHA